MRLQTRFTKLVRNLPDTFIPSTLQVYLMLAGHPALTTVQPSPCCIDERLPVRMPDTCMSYLKVHLSIPIPLQITFLPEMTNLTIPMLVVSHQTALVDLETVEERKRTRLLPQK